VDIYRV